MVIVIGATGFIGMYTVEALLNGGKKVLATGRNDVLGRRLQEMGAEFVNLDITKPEDFEKLPKSGVEGVILLAGLSVTSGRKQHALWRLLRTSSVCPS